MSDILETLEKIQRKFVKFQVKKEGEESKDYNKNKLNSIAQTIDPQLIPEELKDYYLDWIYSPDFVKDRRTRSYHTFVNSM